MANQQFHRFEQTGPPPTVTVMNDEVLPQRVEVSFVGAPPVKQIERASGVSEVRVEGSVVRCVVDGSFQPFLEALRGHEVINLTSTADQGHGGAQQQTAIDLAGHDVNKRSPKESYE